MDSASFDFTTHFLSKYRRGGDRWKKGEYSYGHVFKTKNGGNNGWKLLLMIQE